ncbi:hypothetical protein AMS68_000216 [Peltaster fructicola]|uniref:Uncharacterized protein n=1 Tax=Peltaster fructicola TaxID=286661 RepID=A0A6H0XJ84_9PEZI|nr:hypothetical protein AMS68_000216 [Peltaster fructicola]
MQQDQLVGSRRQRLRPRHSLAAFLKTFVRPFTGAFEAIVSVPSVQAADNDLSRTADVRGLQGVRTNEPPGDASMSDDPLPKRLSLISLDRNLRERIRKALDRWRTIDDVYDHDIYTEDMGSPSVLDTSGTDNGYVHVGDPKRIPTGRLGRRPSWLMGWTTNASTKQNDKCLLYHSFGVDAFRLLTEILEMDEPCEGRATLTPLMKEIDQIRQGDSELLSLPVLQQYYRVCQLFNLLGGEFDECTRDYIKALLLQEDRDDQAMLDIDDQTVDTEHGDERLDAELDRYDNDAEASLATTFPTSQGPAHPELDKQSSGHESESPGGNASMDSVQQPALNSLDDLVTTRSADLTQPRTPAEHIVVTPEWPMAELFPTSQRLPIQSHGSAEVPYDERSNATDPGVIIGKYESIQKDQYERRLDFLENAAGRLKDRCMQLGQEIKIYRDADEIPLANDSFTPITSTGEQYLKHSPDDEEADNHFKTLFETLQDLAPDVEIEHITLERQSNITPVPRDTTAQDERIAMWASDVAVDSMDPRQSGSGPDNG